MLGNTGESSDPRTLATLDRYRSDADQLLAEHAEWASQRLGIDDDARADIVVTNRS